MPTSEYLRILAGRPAALVMERLQNEPVEVCLLLLVNAKGRVLAVHELSAAPSTAALCILDVLRTAILANATGIAVAHNHPSGKTRPITVITTEHLPTVSPTLPHISPRQL